MLFLFLACASTKTSETAEPNTPDVEDTAITEPVEVTYYRDIQPLIERGCNRCHRAGGQTFPMDDHSYPVSYSQLIVREVTSGVRPPPVSNSGCRPYTEDSWFLDEPSQALIERWHNEGAVVGDPADAIPEIDFSSVALETNHFFEGQYTPPRNNISRCFAFPLNNEQPLKLAALNVQIGNEVTAHHANLFLVSGDESFPSGEQNQPGFACAEKGEQDWTYLIGWTNGSRPLNFPEGTHYELPANSQIVLRVFYTIRNTDDSVSDTSGFGYTLQADENSVPVSRHLLEVTGFTIPGNTEDYRVQETITWEQDRALITSVQPRMFWKGDTYNLSKVSASGEEECMVDYHRWDYGTLFPIVYREPLLIEPGDQIQVSCNYNNSSNHDVTGPIANGYGPGDELCELIVHTIPSP